MTDVGQILARRRREPPKDASRSLTTAPGTAERGEGRVSDQSTPYTARNGAVDAVGRAGTRGMRRPPPKLPPYLEGLVVRYSEELHDDDHIPQNLGQAGRLWKVSGWSESAFSQALTEAKAITLRRDIKKRAAVGGEIGARNKMPYYFKVLRDVLGMTGSQGKEARGHDDG